jgi:hypothetical protein
MSGWINRPICAIAKRIEELTAFVAMCCLSGRRAYVVVPTGAAISISASGPALRSISRSNKCEAEGQVSDAAGNSKMRPAAECPNPERLVDAMKQIIGP